MAVVMDWFAKAILVNVPKIARNQAKTLRYVELDGPVPLLFVAMDLSVAEIRNALKNVPQQMKALRNVDLLLPKPTAV